MTRSHTIRIALLLLASVGDLPGDIHAAELGSAWSIGVPFEVTANSFFLSNGRTSTVFESLSVESGIELSPYHKRWSAGAFVEHHIADAVEVDGMSISGIYATWRKGGWKTTTAMMLTRTRSAGGTWQYLNRFKRRLTDRQDLVVLAGIPVDDPDLASIAIGWKVSASTRVTFDLAAGAIIADPKQQIFHVAVKWQLF